MDANKFFKIGVGSLAIVIAIYVVYLMVMPLAVSYYAVSKVHSPEKKVYVEDNPSMEPSPITIDGVEQETVYIDINVGKTTVKVHTGMPKDSVLQILGQPSSSNFGDRFHETCEYNFPNQKWVHLVFNDGKLKKVVQH